MRENLSIAYLMSDRSCCIACSIVSWYSDFHFGTATYVHNQGCNKILLICTKIEIQTAFIGAKPPASGGEERHSLVVGERSML